jgi:recombinational DNA repair protein RecT
MVRSIESRKDDLWMAFQHEHESFDRFFCEALRAVAGVPELLECTPESIVRAMEHCAHLGLVPDLRPGAISIVPASVNVGTRTAPLWIREAAVVPGVRGLLELARRSEIVERVEAEVVHENDCLVHVKGATPYFQHTLWHTREEERPGEIAYVYCFTKYAGDDDDWFAEVLSRQQVNEIIRAPRRDRRLAAAVCGADYRERACKIAIHQASRDWPASSDGRLEQALRWDEQAARGEPQSLASYAGQTRDDAAPLMVKVEGEG